MPIKHDGRDPAYIERRRDARREERERQHDQHQIETIRALHRISDQLATDEEEEKRDHRKRAFRERATILLIFATFAAASVGDLFFYGQMHEMERAYGPIQSQAEAAQKSLVATNRPWLKIKEKIISDLTFGDEGADLTIQIDMSNTGHSPATDVNIAGDLLPCLTFNQPWMGDGCWNQSIPEQQLSRICQERASMVEEIKEARTKPKGLVMLLGVAVFPGEDGHQVVRFTYKIPAPKEPLTFNGLSYVAPFLNQSGLKGPTLLLVCVLYGSSVEDHFYKSGHVFYLERNGEPIDLSSKTPIPEKELVLRPSGLGGADYVQ